MTSLKSESAGETELELLLLSAVQNGEQHFIGVVAVPGGRGRLDEPRERQLLNTVAAQLLALDTAPQR